MILLVMRISRFIVVCINYLLAVTRAQHGLLYTAS